MLCRNCDANGNLKKDLNKGYGTTMAYETTYNHLNLPRQIRWASNKTITYLYDANGTKLEKRVRNGSTVTTTHYDGGIVYKDSILQYFPHAEGYVNVWQPVMINGTPTYRDFEYIYQYKDHLGNIRLSYTKSITGNIEVVEENNYYAFGMKHEGYNSVVTGLGNAEAQKKKYNGKELQDDLGLNMYDYGARNYDPALGRWMNIDPLAETSRRWSPYSYCYNNPMVFVDPDGMQATPPDDIYLNRAGKEIYRVTNDQPDRTFVVKTSDNQSDLYTPDQIASGDAAPVNGITEQAAKETEKEIRSANVNSTSVQNNIVQIENISTLK